MGAVLVTNLLVKQYDIRQETLVSTDCLMPIAELLAFPP
jgi:hypothetical protein